jgi:hypothetical protein
LKIIFNQMSCKAQPLVSCFKILIMFFIHMVKWPAYLSHIFFVTSLSSYIPLFKYLPSIMVLNLTNDQLYSLVLYATFRLVLLKIFLICLSANISERWPFIVGGGRGEFPNKWQDKTILYHMAASIPCIIYI